MKTCPPRLIKAGLPRLIKAGGVVGGIALIFVALFSLYTYNLIPLSQAKNIMDARYTDPGKSERVLVELEQAFSPHNFAQAEIRGFIFDHYYNYVTRVLGTPKYKEIAEIIESSLNEAAEREAKRDPRWYIRQAQLYNTKAKVDPRFYENAEVSMREALKLSPTRQEFYYNLMVALVGQGRYDEALEVVEQAVELSPGVARAHFHLALGYAGKGDKENALSELTRARELDPDLGKFFRSDLRAFLLVYATFGERGMLAEAVVELIHKQPRTPLQPEYVNTALYHFLDEKNAASFKLVAGRIKETFPELGESMDVLIDLAEKERWEILESLVEFEAMPAVESVKVE